MSFQNVFLSFSIGTMVWPSGETYVGYFVDGLFHGRGQRTWPNGDCYSGEYEEGKEHGEVRVAFVYVLNL